MQSVNQPISHGSIHTKVVVLSFKVDVWHDAAHVVSFHVDQQHSNHRHDDPYRQRRPRATQRNQGQRKCGIWRRHRFVSFEYKIAVDSDRFVKVHKHIEFNVSHLIITFFFIH